MALSDDLREELAAIAPARECDRLAELSGLFHVAGRAHLRGRGSVDVHLDVSSSAVARRAFALLRAFGVEVGDPHLPAHAPSTARPATSSTSRARTHAYATLHRAGVLDRSHRPLEPPAAARRRPALLRGRLPPRRAARRRDR